MSHSATSAVATPPVDTAAHIEERSAASSVVTAQNLSTWYGNTKILNGVNLNIARNEITALVGPSGCGKSTFLRCVNRMNDMVRGFRQEGTLILDEDDVRHPSVDVTALRRIVGMVFQHPNPFPMSIRDNILLAVKEHRGRLPRDEAEEILERSLQRANLFSEVKDHLSRSALSLSGGQQQRLCIARALAVMPEVLMLDEPCSSLDPMSTARIEELLLELKGDYTIIIVTHNLAQARRVSDATAFFYLGEIIETGLTSEIISNPQQEQTRKYFAGAFG